MNIAKLFEDYLHMIYLIAIYADSEEEIDNWRLMGEGAMYFVSLSQLVDKETIKKIWWSKYSNLFWKIYEEDFREKEREKYPKKQLTQEEIKERNEELKRILEELEDEQNRLLFVLDVIHLNRQLTKRKRHDIISSQSKGNEVTNNEKRFYYGWRQGAELSF